MAEVVVDLLPDLEKSGGSARETHMPSPRLSRKTQEEVVVENDTASGEDPDNYPLHSPWSFWFDRSQRGGNPGDFFANLRQIATVTSIKAFWRVFNNLPICDHLKDRESYHLMRDKQRRPVWEDADNVDGGMWVIKVEKQCTVRAWQELLLAAIGEQFSLAIHPDDEICGVSVRIRYDGDVIQIWNQDSELSSEAKILDKIKELLPVIEIKSSFYQCNREKLRDSLSKPVSGHRGLSPPPFPMAGRRYPGTTPVYHPMHPPPRASPAYHHSPPSTRFKSPPRSFMPSPQVSHPPPQP